MKIIQVEDLPDELAERVEIFQQLLKEGMKEIMRLAPLAPPHVVSVLISFAASIIAAALHNDEEAALESAAVQSMAFTQAVKQYVKEINAQRAQTE